MPSLPIRRLTLYKHGVGHFERQGAVSGETVRLTFKREEMNDILKSLTAFDLGAGQVLNIAYEAPEDKESRLASGSIHLSAESSLLDLLRDLRGRRIQLELAGESVVGTLIGVDVHTTEPMTRSLVSVLTESEGGSGATVRVVMLERVEQVTLVDDRARADLDFFLDASLTEEAQRAVTLRLTPGDHDLVVGYIAASPTWRVSYRFVGESAPGGEEGPGERRALLQGWGVFDNRLDEDLENVSVSLVAGMPISFIYNLYEPRIPDRPVVEDQDRVAAGPVMFDMAMEQEMMMSPPPAAAAPKIMASMAFEERGGASRSMRSMRAEMAEASPVQASGAAMGEVFRYDISVPVTVRRGEAAMVPILAADLPYRKEHLYNGTKLPNHPVVSVRFKNTTGLTLERGPVTVIEDNVYVGEAMVDFTREEAELTLAYAVDLAIKVSESVKQTRELYSLYIHGAALAIHEWDVLATTYRLTNGSPEAVTVTIEHRRRQGYDPVDMPEPDEVTADHRRWRVPVPPRTTTEFIVSERMLARRTEELARQSVSGLQRYLRRNLLDQKTFAALQGLLSLYDQRRGIDTRLRAIETERQTIYNAQTQVRGNMGNLATSGEEGKLRARYVGQLQQQEDQIAALDREVLSLRTEAQRLDQEIQRAITALEKLKPEPKGQGG